MMRLAVPSQPARRREPDNPRRLLSRPPGQAAARPGMVRWAMSPHRERRIARTKRNHHARLAALPRRLGRD